MQKNQEVGNPATSLPSQESTENAAREELQVELKSCQRQIKGCLIQMIAPLFIGILEAGAQEELSNMLTQSSSRPILNP